MPDPTHRLVKRPQITARYLADYMPASDRARRSILTKCKYQSIIPVVQHTDAKLIIANHLRLRKGDHADLEEKIDRLSRKICDGELEEKQLKFNLDYLRRFAGIEDQIALPAKAEILPTTKLEPLMLNGTKVNFTPNLLVSRVTRTNAVRIGSITFRYSKGNALDEDVAAYQAALAFAYLRERPFREQSEPEHKLCLIVDNFAGKAYEAPGNSIDRFNNMAAACATIADCWEAIKPPPKAVLK